jgi:hypothetical protein
MMHPENPDVKKNANRKMLTEKCASSISKNIMQKHN